MYGLWSETGRRWYAVGGLVVCAASSRLMWAQLVTLKAAEPDDYTAMLWAVRLIGVDGKPVKTWRERVLSWLQTRIGG